VNSGPAETTADSPDPSTAAAGQENGNSAARPESSPTESQVSADDSDAPKHKSAPAAAANTPAPTPPTQPHRQPAPGTAVSKRLEYRWEPGSNYTYYVRSESESNAKNRLEVLAGYATLNATEANLKKPNDADADAGSASAFVVHPDGWLITCAHCVIDV